MLLFAGAGAGFRILFCAGLILFLDKKIQKSFYGESASDAVDLQRRDIYGNHQQLVTGIRQKLLTLPDDTLVYPGHGDCTTVADEKRNNPFLNN